MLSNYGYGTQSRFHQISSIESRAESVNDSLELRKALTLQDQLCDVIQRLLYHSLEWSDQLDAIADVDPQYKPKADAYITLIKEANDLCKKASLR